MQGMIDLQNIVITTLALCFSGLITAGVVGAGWFIKEYYKK